MVRDYAVMHILRAIRINARGMSRRFDKCLEQISIVIVMAALKQRANALKSHARINRLHVEIAHRAVLKLLVLHENNVPDLDKAVAVLFRAARRAAPNMLTVVIKNLGARPAWPRWTHLPIVV